MEEKEKITARQSEPKTAASKPEPGIKDSVFTELFRNKTQLLALYQTLHPEDREACETDLKDLTMEAVLGDDLRHKLSFYVKDQLIMLVETKIPQPKNIALYLFLYLSEMLIRYLEKNGLNIWSQERIPLPDFQLYAIYTGEELRTPSERQVLTEDFSRSIPAGFPVQQVKVFCEPGDDIIGQYISFCQISEAQVRKYGLSLQAIEETVRICKEKNVLRAYLTEDEAKVKKIMEEQFRTDQYLAEIAGQEESRRAEKAIEETIRIGTEKNILAEYLTEHGLEAENAMQELFSAERDLAEATAREKEARIREKKAQAEAKKARKENMAAIMNLYLHNGLSVSAIAQAFGMDPDEVEKIIANHS